MKPPVIPVFVKLKNQKIALLIMLVLSGLSLFAQHSNNAAGGNATSIHGSMSYSIGQVFTQNFGGLEMTFTSGVQQAYESMQNNIKLLNLKVFLEGPFLAEGMHTHLFSSSLVPLAQPYNTEPWNYDGNESVDAIPDDAVDWVLVELRDADSPENASTATKLEGWPKAMFLKTDGSLLGLDGAIPSINSPVVTHNLYLVIRHRNHLDVMSSTPLVPDGNTYTYDFTDAITKAYGGATGYKQVADGFYGMVSGDLDADGSVFASDFNLWAVNFGMVTVYLPADADMDGQVFASDFNKWAVNFGINTGNRKMNYKSQVP